MSKLFDLSEVKNHPRRSGFDLSKKRAFTAKPGELLPVWWRLCYPGDSFELGHRHFTRTQPVNTAAFTRIREYFDWYYVPLRLLNKNIGQALVQMQNNPVQAQSVTESRSIVLDIPYAPLASGIAYAVSSSDSAPTGGYALKPTDVNVFGFKLTACTMKLLQYLGYGYLFSSVDTSGVTSADVGFKRSINVNLNLLPLLAYQKIYSDYFRYSQWEKNEPYTYNVDYYTGGNLFLKLSPDGEGDGTWRTYLLSNNIFTLRYANWPKDMFMGLLPNQQYGNIATVEVNGALQPFDFSGGDYPNMNLVPLVWNPGGLPSQLLKGNAQASSTDVSLTSTNPPSSVQTGREVGLSQNWMRLNASFDIIQLRLAEATQKWREICQTHDQTYRDQIYAHFGVRLSKALADQCEYIGGSATNMDISPVVNQNLNPGENTGDAYIKGKGEGSSQGRQKFTCNEHGVLMCIYHAVPLLDYILTGPAMELMYTSTDDLPQPEFDSIGLQSVPFLALSNDYNLYVDTASASLKPTSIMGYGPRFIDLKTSVDDVVGAFTTTLKDWVAPISPEYIHDWFTYGGAGQSSVNYNFFKVNPHVLDSIFAVKADSTWDTDPLLVNAYFDIKAVRNFDYDGMPY